jgi:hypothetical protein
MSSLDNVKLILEIDLDDESEDDLLNLYISRASNFVKSYCSVTEISSELAELVEDIAVYNYRNKGIENIKSEGKGSLSESYRDSLPKDYIQRLNQHRRLKFV